MVTRINNEIKLSGAVVMVGAFPPPVHGMAAVNAAVRNCLLENGVIPLVIDISANSLKRSIAWRLGRLPKIVRGLVRLLFSQSLRSGTLYMAVSGGFGQFYETCFLLLARLHGMRVYLHHHSFAYLNRSSRLTHVLAKVAGSACVHITQSPVMAARLRAQYVGVCRIVPISNAVFFVGRQAEVGIARPELTTIGFLSNISTEKGIVDFLDLVAACEQENLGLKARLAGPFQDAGTERLVRNRIEELSSVEYVGPQYGNDKELFFNSIDVFIFPTLYANETEGIVNHEALSHGLPIIAYGRGCIPEIVNSDCGLVIEPTKKFVPSALSQIKQWRCSPEEYQSASRAASERFSSILDDNSRRWQKLLREILDDNINTSDVIS